MAKREYRAVLIGCGARAAAHIEAYAEIEGAAAVACYAPSATRRGPLAEKYGLKAYDSLGAMLAGEKPDIAHIITKPSLRYEIMKAVSDAGVPLCTVEKPIATGVEDWRALARLEAGSGTRFAVCHQLRWHPNLMKCRVALDAAAAAAKGGAGGVRFVDMTCGMNISGQGTHILDYGRYLAGDPRVVSVFGSASGWDDSDPYHSGPRATEAALAFDNGARGLWATGYTSPRCGDPATVWQHVRVAAYAAAGRAEFQEFGVWEARGGGLDADGDCGGMEGWAALNLQAQTGFHRAMIAWLEGGVAPGTALEASLHEWKVVLALYESALCRAPVELASFDPAPDLPARLEAALRA